MPLRTKLEFPKTEARQRWAATLKAGLDLEELLGLPSAGSDIVLSGAAAVGAVAAIESKLYDVGTVESVDFKQTRSIKERFAFGPDPLVSFQTVPQQVTYSLSLSRIVLRRLPQVEAFLNFLPSNLILQQAPFIIELRDAGDGTPESEIRHIIFGCWFADSSVRYDVSTKDDTRLIQTASVKTGRVLTFDPSAGGSPVATVGSNLVSALIASSEGAQTLIEDMGLS